MSASPEASNDQAIDRPTSADRAQTNGASPSGEDPGARSPTAPTEARLAASLGALAVIGVSYREAPIAVRERVAIAADERAQVLVALRDGSVVREAMAISTCNRVEVYVATGGDVEAAKARVESALSLRARGEAAGPSFYAHTGVGAVRHAFRVAASLDSLVVGEPQILGQFKDAFEAANEAGTIGGELTRVVSRAFFVAKRVRSETALGAGQVSVASVAVELAKRIHNDLDEREVLLLGAGEIAESAARALVSAGARRVTIANRSLEKAEALARSIASPPARGDTTRATHVDARPLSDVAALLEKADVVLVSTGSPSFVVTREMAAAAIKRRKGAPLFFVDLAVPRNVDPRVHDVDNCYRYDIDDLEQIVANGIAARRDEAAAADALVEAEVDAFARAARQRDVAPTIVALRNRVRAHLSAELDRTLAGRLKHLNDDDRKALAAMIEAAANKLLHAPTVALKDADGDDLAAATKRLFGLENDGER